MNQQNRKLYRSKNNRMLAGVCSGLGDYMGFDVNIIRLCFVVLTLVTGGMGIAAYLAGLVLVPEEGASESLLDKWSNRNSDGPRDSFRSDGN